MQEKNSKAIKQKDGLIYKYVNTQMREREREHPFTHF